MLQLEHHAHAAPKLYLGVRQMPSRSKVSQVIRICLTPVNRPTALRRCQGPGLRSGNEDKNLVALYVLLVHGEGLAAIKAYEFEQDAHVVHLYRAP